MQANEIASPHLLRWGGERWGKWGIHGGRTPPPPPPPYWGWGVVGVARVLRLAEHFEVGKILGRVR